MPRKKKPTLQQQLQMDLQDCSGLHSTTMSFPVSPSTVINYTSTPPITWVTPPPSPLTTPRIGATNHLQTYSDVIKDVYAATLAQMSQTLYTAVVQQDVFGMGQIVAPDHRVRLPYNVCPQCALVLPHHIKTHQHAFCVKKSHVLKGWWDGDKDVGSEAHYRTENFKTIMVYSDDYDAFKAYVEACNAEEKSC